VIVRISGTKQPFAFLWSSSKNVADTYLHGACRRIRTDDLNIRMIAGPGVSPQVSFNVCTELIGLKKSARSRLAAVQQVEFGPRSRGRHSQALDVPSLSAALAQFTVIRRALAVVGGHVLEIS
jgi:hypothetical protein